jgi:hypothetical protein
MYDPMEQRNKMTPQQTNIVLNVLYWNVIGCIFSFFIFLFDGVLGMENIQKGNAVGERKEFATILGLKRLLTWSLGLLLHCQFFGL